MPTLSLCLIAKDEAANLPRCLESVRGIVDEIVVVDTGSSDETLSIARGFGAKIFSFPWCDDFSAARNESLSHASGDWILVLDADEWLLPGASTALRECLSGKCDAYFLTLENRLDESGLFQNIRLVRLFRRLPGLRYRGRVHEQLDNLHLSIGDCGARIRHDGYTPSVIAERGKHLRNLRLLEKNLSEHPDDLYSHYQLGKTLAAMEKREEAEKAFRDTLEKLCRHPRSSSYAFFPKLFIHLAALMEKKKGIGEALSVMRQGLTFLPGEPEILWYLGFYLKEAGQEDEALSQFERAFTLTNRFNASGVDFFHLKDQVSQSLVELWQKKAVRLLQAGELESATTAYQNVLLYQPEHFFSHLALATIHFEQKRFELALSALLEADRLRPGQPDIAFLARECRKHLND